MQPEYKFDDWFSGNIPLWSRALAELRGRPNLSFLEIGSFEGRSARWLLENILTHSTSFLTCIDTFGGGMEHTRMDLEGLESRFRRNIEPWRSRVAVCVGTSGEKLRLQAPSERFDFIYIDGSHVAGDVLQDAVLAWPLLKTGGLMAFDDYGWLPPDNKDERFGPKLAIDAFLSCRTDSAFWCKGGGSSQMWVQKV